jgi:peptide/nickel transport system substrate-binding protein
MFCLRNCNNLAGRTVNRMVRRATKQAVTAGCISLAAVLLLTACDRLTNLPVPAGLMKATQTLMVGGKKSPTPKSTRTPNPTRTSKPTRTPKPTVPPTPEVKNVLTIHLKSGLHWSDGSDLLAKDVVGAYNIWWAEKNSIWSSIEDVIARDDHTVDFLISKPSARLLYKLLRSSPMAPYSQYGDWMDQTGDARKAGYLPDSPEVKKVLDNLYAFKPAAVVASGPFVLKPLSVSNTMLELVKNPAGYHAERIDFDRIVVYYAGAVASTAMLLYNKIDYSQYPYSPSDLKRFESMEYLQVIRSPTGEGPGLWFNEAIHPLDQKEVRQAFAYIIDRDQAASLAVGEMGQAVSYLTGLTDTQAETWLTPATISRLNLYKKDWSRAEELLKSAGCSKDAQGKWVDGQGEPMSYELSAPDDKADWIKAGEQAASQLTDFGIPAVLKTYPAADRASMQKEGRYQILIDLSVYYSPAYAYAPFAYYLMEPRNNPEATNNQFGLKWPWKQSATDGQVYDIPKLVNVLPGGLDFKAQQPAVQTLALILNDQLPVLALFESYTAAPINTVARVDGWLAGDDPIYKNGQQADNPIAIQFLDGQLTRSVKGDGSFTTVAIYPRASAYEINIFKQNNLLRGVGTFSYDVMYPPLFWFRWADGDYAAALAESYEIR